MSPQIRAIDLKALKELACPIADSRDDVQRMIRESVYDLLDGIALLGGTEEGLIELFFYSIDDVLMEP